MRRLVATWLPIVLAAALGALLYRRGPLPTSDPFAGTLAILPVIVTSLAALGRWARRRGVAEVPPAWRLGEAAVTVALALLAVARAHLRLPGTELPLAAGFVLVLAIYLARRVPALEPLLGQRLPARPAAIFFLLPLVVYLALLPWSTFHRPPDGDEPWYLLITHSLADDGDAELTDEYAEESWRRFLERPLEPQPGDPQGSDGELYSRHNALLPLLLVPGYLIAGRFGALAVMAALTAALAWVTLRLARRYFPEHPRGALAAWALLAFTPPLLLYSYQVWVEVPAALVSMLALDAILGLGRPREASATAAGSGGADRRRWLMIAACLVLLPLLKIRFMLLAAPLLALAWWHAGRPRRLIAGLAAALVAVGGGILVHNQLRYGNPLKIHSWQEVGLHRYQLGDYLAGAGGLFFDVAFGLFAAAPVWLLLLPALLLLARRRHPLGGDLLVFALPYLLIVAPRGEWYGGWSPPFRYALVWLPLLALALVPMVGSRITPEDGASGPRPQGPRRALVAGLALATLALTLLWVAVPGWTYNFADGRTYLLDHLSSRLDADVARLFPSMVRPRAASWIWPPLLVVLVSALWWLRLPLRRPAAWGAAALLAAAALVPAAARHLPTRVIELEDPQVVKTGGHLHPERWVIERTRYHGGWVLREGERLTAPVVPGGERVRLTLEAFFVRHNPRPARLEVRAGGELLETIELEHPRSWQTIELGEHPWPPAARSLSLALVAPDHRRRPSGLVADRLELDWR